jgi:HAD superfamily hydrolase (TIGR01509 family)
MFKAVVFDLDGVIVDSELYHYRSIKQALTPHELELTYEDFRNGYTGGSDRDTIGRICLAFDIAFDDPQLDSWRAIKADVYQTLIRDGLRPLPGAANLIRSVADELPIGLATGSRRSDLEAVFATIEKGQLRERFEVTVTADDVVNPKPHPETYATAVAKLGIESKQCIEI